MKRGWIITGFKVTALKGLLDQDCLFLQVTLSSSDKFLNALQAATAQNDAKCLSSNGLAP
jgi:hypothetical protein